MIEQQDFFIYVPDVSVPAPLTDTYVQVTPDADRPPGDTEWVKIPLTEELVVYAHITSETPSVALC